MSIGNSQVGNAVRLTSSGVIAGGAAMARTYAGGSNNPASVAETTALAGAILGFYSNVANGTLLLSTNNAGAAGTALTPVITYATVGWIPCPIASASGIFATIGGSGDFTFSVVE